MMHDDRIGILGPGAVGHMLSFFFKQMPGVQVQLQGRQGRLAKACGIRWQGAQHELQLSSEGPAADLWFVCLKAYALTEGLRAFCQTAASGTRLIILSNGYIENLLQPIRLEFPKLQLRKGLVTRGIKALADGTYAIGREGAVIWGDASGPSPLEERILQELGAFGFRWDQETCRLRREKWFYNTCLNTLCAVHQLPRNGLALESWESELRALAGEVHALAAELWPDWKPAAPELWQNLSRLIAATADNENSMAADVRLGRRNEAAVLSGLVHQARDAQRYPLLLEYDQKLGALFSEAAGP